MRSTTDYTAAVSAPLNAVADERSPDPDGVPGLRQFFSEGDAAEVEAKIEMVEAMVRALRDAARPARVNGDHAICETVTRSLRDVKRAADDLSLAAQAAARDLADASKSHADLNRYLARAGRKAIIVNEEMSLGYMLLDSGEIITVLAEESAFIPNDNDLITGGEVE